MIEVNPDESITLHPGPNQTRQVQVVRHEAPRYDDRVISPRFYQRFTLERFPVEYRRDRLSLAVTSARGGEGKTLVACNLAVSIALGYGRKTVLVDMSTRRPALHRVFGLNSGPGLAEALRQEQMELSATAFSGLFVMTAGFDLTRDDPFRNTVLLRQVVRSLERYFDYIVLDMNPVFPLETFPALFAGEVDGVLAVVDARSTTRHDLRAMDRHLPEDRFMGYVMNRLRD